jgi:aspartate/methionine/tyrosine aminotransferase
MISTPQTTFSIAPADRLGEVQEYYFSKKLREIAQLQAMGKHIINLGIGSPDLPPHPSVIRTLQEAAAHPDNHAYQSYSGIPELRTAFAEWYQRYFDVELNPASEVLPLIGSKEGIMHLSMAFLNSGDEVLVPNPGYPTYRAAAELAGARVRYYELNADRGWLPDLDELAGSDLQRVKIMWVNYPHMPTGTPASAEFFRDLVDFARANRILLVNDNPYAFILAQQQTSLLAAPGAREVALELNSLSKAHNMAGWRVGALLGRSELVQTVLRFKSNMDSGMYKPLQLAAVTALRLEPTWYADLNAHYRERRMAARAILDELGCKYDQDQVGLFVWAAVPEKTGDGFALSDRVLYENDVFLTPGGIFGDRGIPYVRISLCGSTEQFELALDRIRQSTKGGTRL